MSNNSITDSRQAFEITLEGMRVLNRFREGGDRVALKEADRLFDKALSYDAKYGIALYYKRVTTVLLGGPDPAASHER